MADYVTKAIRGIDRKFIDIYDKSDIRGEDIIIGENRVEKIKSLKYGLIAILSREGRN